jgi:hypothetical protein
MTAADHEVPPANNSQPWRFRQREQAVEVFADRSRQLPVADPTGWAVRVSCGAAPFNLRLALGKRLLGFIDLDQTDYYDWATSSGSAAHDDHVPSSEAAS